MVCPWNDFKQCFGSLCPYYGVVENYATTTTTSRVIKYGCRRVGLTPIEDPIKENFYGEIMLEGITVLSENTVSPLGLGITFIIIGVVAILISVSLSILVLSTRDYSLCVLPFAICIIGLTCLIAGIMQCCEKPEVEYKVTIDDTVNFKEFNDRYTIIDQDGDIYKIIEKESK